MGSSLSVWSNMERRRKGGTAGTGTGNGGTASPGDTRLSDGSDQVVLW